METGVQEGGRRQMKLFRKRKKAENVKIRENVIAEEMPEGGDSGKPDAG